MIGDALVDRSSAAESVLRGLARNPVAPPDVLVRLLQATPSLFCQGLKDRRDLPRPVQDAMVHHPQPRIITLLDDPDLAEHAAANPALPVDGMRHILQNAPEPTA